MNVEVLKIVRDNIEMGSVLSFTEVMIIQQAIDAVMLQAEPVSQPYKLPPNSFTNDDLEMMAHGDNPQANAYRELLAFRHNSPVIPDCLNVRAVAALREAVRNQWLKSEDFADKVYWKSMHDIANEIVSAMLAAAPQQEGSDV